MKTVIFDLFDSKQLKASMKRAIATGETETPRVSFVSVEDMLKALGGRRMEMIKVLAGIGAVGIRELARRLDRDVRAVHADVQTLIEYGVLDKLDDGKVEFPYDAVHVDFMWVQKNRTPQTYPQIGKLYRCMWVCMPTVQKQKTRDIRGF